jgi:stage III sporulation protein SpoIIIAA
MVPPTILNLTIVLCDQVFGYCNPALEDDHRDTVLNPLVIFEIRSPSTGRSLALEDVYRRVEFA